MRILITLFASFTAFAYVALFLPADASTAEPAEALIYVVCPDYVDTEISNPPQGWTAVAIPAVARINFQQIGVEEHTVVCHYTNQKDAFASYLLGKTFPTNYKCSVVKSAQASPRTATCAPRIKTGKN